jgi:hypothetical protein
MKPIFLIFCISFFPSGSLLCQTQGADSAFAVYHKLNEGETRLAEYKDSDEMLRLKITQLALINKSRKKYHAPPVKLDILASRVANKVCEEAALNKYMGHWNMKGEKPYHRYAGAGGQDHVAENASSSTYSGNGVFPDSPELVAEQMAKLHLSFMAEKAPDDGHKKNCIDKVHNYVGLGVYRTDKEFRYYEEFLDRYYTFVDVPLQAEVKIPVTIKLKPEQGKYFYYLLTYREELKSMTPAKISARKHYDDFGPKKGIEYMPWQLAGFRKDSGYEIPLTFTKPGLYYVNIYEFDKELKKPAAYDTKGKIQGSGIVIEVR